jgi:hypothetical protein
MIRTRSPYRRSLGYRLAQFATWVDEQRRASPRLDEEWLERRALTIAEHPSFAGISFREPLHRLVASLRGEARLNALGRAHAAGTLLGQLVTRACLETNWCGPTPRSQDLLRPARPPVFIFGLHRTGTTLLQRLLAADPAARPLLYWESYNPLVTIDRGRANGSPAARRQSATDVLNIVRRIAPYLDGIHDTEADGPEECYWLLMASLVTEAFPLQWRVGGYRDWLDARTEADWDAAYREYLSLLHLLDGGMTDRHWVLKCPFHAPRVDTLARLVPTAIFVQTYRDIRESAGSLCSMTTALRAMGSDTWDPVGDGRDVLAGLRRSMPAAMRAARLHPDRVIDVHYRDLVRDPTATIRRIYERAGLPWTVDAEAAIRSRLASGTQHGGGRHRYSLAEFGLAEADVEAACPEYVDMERRILLGQRS